MNAVLFLDPTNRKLWDEQTRHLLAFWWLSGGLCLMFATLALITLIGVLPQRIQAKVAHDAFLASSRNTGAIITGCARLSGHPARVGYQFVPIGGMTEKGISSYSSTCADHPIGGEMMIRYNPAKPSQSEGVGQINQIDRQFYGSLLTLTVSLIDVAVFGWTGIYGLLLSIKGRVRIGRIVSVHPLIRPFSLIRYHVTAADGLQSSGWRLIWDEDITPTLKPAAPIPVLYANKRVHWAFSLLTRRYMLPQRSHRSVHP